VIIALCILGVFALGGVAMAIFTFGMSFLILMDTTHLRAAMFAAVVVFIGIGMFYSARFFIQVSSSRHEFLGKDGD
jgi:hypothetical protein